ncbi:hypothetical protein MNBD_PLANCTO03-247 [hydrothermal vent metagenome]|uniref:PIN domain-containing protein n=1 Tax=hydrothermal vent metagenome TaxID=652676 RepID=A0A3B1DK99_9ZZZZ
MSALQRPLRAYLDTSVFGGVFDAGFDEASRAFIDSIRVGRVIAMVGSTTLAELSQAPDRVQAVLAELPPESVVRCGITEEVECLRDAYLDAGVLTPKWTDDATHVATATVHDADILVSWNFRHIVNYDKIRLFNAVNVRLGYRQIAIHSPLELQHDDEP